MVDSFALRATVVGVQQTTIVPTVDDDVGLSLDDGYAVVLYNDEHNTMPFVVKALMRVFGHPVALAEKIMREAHEKNRAIAEVEDKEQAVLHKQQLVSLGLTAGVEKVA